MRSFRSKPVGWVGESHRHYLAAKYGSAGKMKVAYIYEPYGLPRGLEQKDTYLTADDYSLVKELMASGISKKDALLEVQGRAHLPRSEEQMIKEKRYFAERGAIPDFGGRTEKEKLESYRIAMGARRKKNNNLGTDPDKPRGMRRLEDQEGRKVLNDDDYKIMMNSPGLKDFPNETMYTSISAYMLELDKKNKEYFDEVAEVGTDSNEVREISKDMEEDYVEASMSKEDARKRVKAVLKRSKAFEPAVMTSDDPDELLFAKKDVKKMAEEEFEKFENELTPFQRRRLDKLRMTGKPYNPGESIQAITIRTRKKMMEDKKKLSSEEFERQYGTQAENVMKGFEDKYLK